VTVASAVVASIASDSVDVYFGDDNGDEDDDDVCGEEVPAMEPKSTMTRRRPIPASYTRRFAEPFDRLHRKWVPQGPGTRSVISRAVSRNPAVGCDARDNERRPTARSISSWTRARRQPSNRGRRRRQQPGCRLTDRRMNAIENRFSGGISVRYRLATEFNYCVVFGRRLL
jgi:hypothetical protein